MAVPLLKLLAELVHNRTQRITFDTSSVNGILLFRELSRLARAAPSCQGALQGGTPASVCGGGPYRPRCSGTAPAKGAWLRPRRGDAYIARATAASRYGG